MGTAERFKQSLGLGKALAAAPARVRDAVGRILEIGDEVLVVAPKFPMRVAEITPVIEQPGTPPGMMRLTVVARLAILVPRDTGLDDIYFTRHQKEIGDGAIDLGAGQEQEQKQEATGETPA